MEIQLQDPDKQVLAMFQAGNPVATTDDGKRWKLVHVKRVDETITLRFEETE